MDPVGRLTKEKQKKIKMVIVYGQDTILKINKEFNNKYTITYIYIFDDQNTIFGLDPLF